MTRLSKALSILALMTAANFAHAFATAPKMPCGTYHASGWLRFNSQGQPLIAIQENTASRYELLLLHPDFQQLVLLRDTMISAEVYVGREIYGNKKPIVIFKKWLDKFLPADNAVQFVRKGECLK
jgi:hypothetical protein